MKNNYMELKFKSDSVNEGFARVCVATFCLPLNPSLEQISDIKTAISEAVTNCVVHAYPKGLGEIIIRCELIGDTLKTEIEDNGIGIKDIEKAREPFYTTKPSDERSGMGFAVMECFMDKVLVETKEKGRGTVVTMYKQIQNAGENIEGENA